MNNRERNIYTLEHIIKYCDEISDAQTYFGNSFEVFKTNSIYRNAVAMCILQIGELSGLLTDIFKETYNVVPWRNIKDMRNIMAHKYGNINTSTVWEAVIDDVPVLCNYCNSILKKYSILELPTLEAENDKE